MKLRRTFAVVLCLLLLSLQSQALVHPLSHLKLERQDTGLASNAVDTPCLQCALLAGGTATAVAHAATRHVDVVAGVVVHLRSLRASGAPAWFHSRAPPSLLV
jgi:hypothetical protein